MTHLPQDLPTQPALSDPIAIIGIGCRFPGGANDRQSYWDLLQSGRNAISQTPEERWNLQKFYAADGTQPGKTQSQWGGYVDDIDQFDPQLFGISPREAASMDPQQRMLLEVTWRALEDAGVPVEKVAGQPVSVFAGISSFDYAVAGLSYQDRGVISPYSNTGGSSSIAANRISYCFDLRGPSVAVDTACSSSLVAVHMACESLLRGDAHMALAGGVNALLMPDFYVAFSQLGVLSPDGQCKTFDARANGYVRSEGAGMVLLKPLHAAIRDGDKIYSVIRATALNQDGRTQGMTVPSQSAQETLLRTACERAGINPASIDYVEAHGTGTPVGDPIEANALASVLCEDRPKDRPCVMGSVKTNIGHLEAGAGIASVIKVALALHHKRIPAHLNFESANPKIDLAKLNLRIPLKTEDWNNDDDGRRIAGINGFGYGGANAHVLMEDAPPVTTPTQLSFTDPAKSSPARVNGNANGHSKSEPVILPISARSKPALADVAAELSRWLQADGRNHSMKEIAGFIAHRRSHQECRAAVVGTSASQWITQLDEIAENPETGFAQPLGQSELEKGVLFVCSGQGPQWWAMGRELYKTNSVFYNSIEQCDREFAKYVPWSLVSELSRSEAHSKMQQTSIAQPCIFALQISLAAVWADRGILPSAIVGHSVGEIAAAYLSGALSWQDACCVAVNRGRTMDLASSRGAMIAAGLSPEETRQWIKGLEGDVSLAAINGPTSVTISGADDVIEQLAQRLDDAGIFCRRLKVEYAFHSPQMTPVREELLRSLANIQPKETHTKLISTVTGDYIDGREVGAEYWWKNVRQSVLFADAMSVASKEGYGLALEVGPHPVLTYSITECFQQHKKPVRVFPSLHRDREENLCMSDSLGSLYTVGLDFDWSKVYAAPTDWIQPPTYPFQRQRCWSESFESKVTRLAQSHPLLGETTHAATPSWRSRVELKSQQYLADHCVRDACMFPAAGMMEIFAAAARQIKESDSVVLQRLQLVSPCILDEARPRHFETTFYPERRMLELACREVDESQWQPMAKVFVSDDAKGDDYDASALAAANERCGEAYDQERLYAYCERLGLQYESRFRGIVSGVRRDGEAVARVELPASIASEQSDYGIHPALLDSCFHAMIAADADFDHTLGGLYLPSEIREIRMFKPSPAHVTAHVRLISKDQYRMVADIDIVDADGNACLLIRGFVSQAVGAKPEEEETVHDLVYRYKWAESDLPESVEAGTHRSWCLFIDQGSLGNDLARRLRERGDQVVTVLHGPGYHAIDAGALVIDPEERNDFQRLFTEHNFTDIVYLWGLDVPSTDELTDKSLDKSTQLTSLAPMHLVQAWEAADENANAKMAVVTTGAQSTEVMAEKVTVAQGPLIGFGRVIVSEYGRFATRLVDLPSASQSDAIEYLIAEIDAADSDDEDEIMYRDGKRWVHRFVPQFDEPLTSDAAQTLPSTLTLGRSSGISELQYRASFGRPLAAGEIEIEVLASGLNFSDVMKALDLYPGLPDGPVALGAECAGRVSRVADDVSDWNVGDEVIAVAPGSFATHVCVNADLVAKKPAGMSFPEAATIPIAFLTAEYALNECARMRASDSVLIHSASGGVGLAAMQLAKIAGVKVFATAGNDEKRGYVRDLGAEHVMDSRSLRFADDTLTATDGQGVDVILNSLPGEAITKGLSILKTGGRFLEIGKRDIYSDAPLGLYPFRNNLAMFAIDLDQLFKQQPARMGEMLRQLVPRFESGELKPLPTKTYQVDETRDAYRFMQQGKHIGKVAVDYQARPTEILPGEHGQIQFREDATYWLAGGLGGFGLQIARWMVAKGARNLVLSGRSKQPSAEAQQAINEMTGVGANVTVMPADITNVEDVRRVVQTINETLPPLKGVFHTAMVLEDRLLVDLDRETLQRVLRPKVIGGWNMHAETTQLDLDHFVLFSSLSSVFGHAGQANYSAANALLDSLAHHRRACGLRATVMNWGHLGEVGYLAQREQLGERLERQGVLSFTVKQATDSLEYALQTHALQLSVLRMDWSLWRGLGITSRVSPRFAHLLRNRGSAAGGSSDELASAEEIRSADSATRLTMVSAILRQKAGALLGIDCEQIERNRPLLELGLDSLMAVEMRNWIESQIDINLPISALMRSASLDHLTESVCEIVVGDTCTVADEAPTISSGQADELLEELPDLSDNEVSDLLAKMLREQDNA